MLPVHAKDVIEDEVARQAEGSFGGRHRLAAQVRQRQDEVAMLVAVLRDVGTQSCDEARLLGFEVTACVLGHTEECLLCHLRVSAARERCVEMISEREEALVLFIDAGGADGEEVLPDEEGARVARRGQGRTASFADSGDEGPMLIAHEEPVTRKEPRHRGFWPGLLDGGWSTTRAISIAVLHTYSRFGRVPRPHDTDAARHRHLAEQ